MTLTQDIECMLTEMNSEQHCYFKDEQGRKQGEYKSWYTTGQMREHRFYVNDKRHGEYKTWHMNGQLRELIQYDNGKRHGVHKSWYTTGLPQQDTYFISGLPHGEYKEWNIDSTIDHHKMFVHGGDITDEVKAVVNDIKNITDEERTLIKLTWGIECLPK